MRYVYGLLLLLLLVPAPLQAVCPAGVEVGIGCGELSYAGCCVNSTTVTWCEADGSVCQLDCGNNQAPSVTNDCCEASPLSTAGCCNNDVMACVCATDAYCCTTSWDSLCAGEVESLGCGTCPSGCSGASSFCGWKPEKSYYDCSSASSSDPTGMNPMMCSGEGCVANCFGKQCGDDGCGGSCGTCGFGQMCNVFGECESSCTPNCYGKECGDDG